MNDLDLCMLCLGQKATDTHEILPRSKGGSLCKENQVRLCRSCHMKIHNEGTSKWHDRLLLAKQYYEEVFTPD